MQVAYRWKVLNMLKLYVEKEEGKNFFFANIGHLFMKVSFTA